jgi:hypothetical protein
VPGVFSWPMSAACNTIANHCTGIVEICRGICGRS